MKNYDEDSPPTSSKSDRKNLLELLKDLSKFIENNFKGFDILRKEIYSIENILKERKVRICFIGHLGVGKSTVLNCIIGEDILPIKQIESSNRTIIIKYEDTSELQLYKAKLELICEGNPLEYYKFKEEECFCKGINNIRLFLKNDNDNKKNTFVIIKGKLRIFDFIEIDEKYKNKIEFLDLPGSNIDNKNQINTILRYVNSFIFLNDPQSIEDMPYIYKMIDEYQSYRNHIDIRMREKYDNICIFLINKIDILSDKNREKEENKIRKDIFNIINKYKINNNEKNINISFFSGKYFEQFLMYYKNYVELIENNPFLLLENLYKEWAFSSFYSRGFKDYILKTISTVQEKLELKSQTKECDKEEDIEIKIPSKFYETFNKVFTQLEVYQIKISVEDKKEIIENLYKLFTKIKTKNFDHTNYSQLFFKKIKEMIITCDNFQYDMFKKIIDNYSETVEDFANRKLG